VFDGGRGGNKKGGIMEETPFLRFVFLTLPTSTEPTLNITIGDEHKRYRVTRDQLYNLNAQIADALVRGRISPGPGQLSFELGSDSATSGSA
jgi:hypothetical protein